MIDSTLSPAKGSSTNFMFSFCKNITAVKHKEQLVNVINEDLRCFLRFDHATIFFINEEKEVISDFLCEEQNGEYYPFKNSISSKKVVAQFDYEVKNNDLENISFIHLNQANDADLWIDKKAFKYIDLIIIPIAPANSRIGYLALVYKNDPKDFNGSSELLRFIINQLFMVTARLRAEEEQLLEINNYKQLLEEEKTYLKEEIETVHNYSEIIGDSPSMQKVFRMVAQVAHADSTVLLLGETGTGKELVARAIHNNSPRRNKLMVKVNCAALPANLIESELFGHERGSFTGATERRLGKFELANGGTLFLDEIGEMPVDLQVKLLRALQEREIERVGGRGIIKVDVRIIAATNRDLEKEMDEGRFRSDLYYRLNIFPIELPPLRHRKEDIPLLATHFINRFSKKVGRKIKMISTKALQDMSLYYWPGNIRELEHLMERSILLSEGETLKTIHLPTQKKISSQEAEKGEFIIRTIDENEREHIIQILKYCKGRVGGYLGAAELLDVPASTLFSKMKKLNIRRDIVE